MVKIGEGETAEVFRIEEGRVIKLFRKDFLEEEDIQMEIETVKTMAQFPDLAPGFFGTFEMESRKGYIMEEVKGPLFLESIDGEPDQFNHHAEAFGTAHRKLHDMEIPAKLVSIPKCSEFMNRFFSSNAVFSKEMNKWFSDLLEEVDRETSLLHGDFMPYNIIHHREGSRESLKVLDWAEPSLGSGVLDVARTLNFILDPTAHKDSLMTRYSAEFCTAYLRGYYSFESVPVEELNKAFLINSIFEVSWAKKSGQEDEYSKKLFAWIQQKFESKQFETELEFIGL